MRSEGSYFQQYNLFGDACGIPQGTICVRPTDEELYMCIRLVEEEWSEETLTALEKYRTETSLENFADVADGIVDTIYVLCQLGRCLGVPLDRVWDEVHAANMRKIGSDGKVKRREDGKILKPANWQPPAVWEICFKEWTDSQIKMTGLKALGDKVANRQRSWNWN